MQTNTPILQKEHRIELFEFSDVQDAFSDLAFNIPSTHGSLPRVCPLNQSLDHVKKLGCKTIVRQHDVQDPDFSAEYYAYYSRMFGKIDKYCHRFHFFSNSISPGEDVLDFIDRSSELDDNYLGFVTIRPVRSSPVAATILRSLPDQHFLLSRDKFDVHLAGKRFSVSGTPFMQQDNAVGACAQASIWMALRTMRKKEGNSAFDPAQITGAATRFLVRGRTLPNREGLGADQMIEAIRFAGYSPHIMQFITESMLEGVELYHAKRKIYTYVESEIPVVLGVFPSPITGHAIVLIGHNWDENNYPLHFLDLNGLKIYHASEWVTNFIAHNDNTGPYITLSETGTENYRLEQVRFAIPLLPSDVFMSGEEAEEVALSLLRNIFKTDNQETSPGAIHPQIKFKDGLVYRTYLVERHKFREWVTKNTDIHAEVKKYYRLKTLPKRIWVTEINLISQFNGASKGGLSRVGELIIDPTGEPNDAPFLSIHLNISAIVESANDQGVVFDRDANSQTIRAIPVQGDTSYSALCRT